MIAIAKRGKEMPPSPIRKLKPVADQAIAKGRKIYQLNIGQPDIETPPEMLDAVKRIEIPVIAYGPSQGLPEYQKALLKYYAANDINLTADELIITTGGSEAILMGFIICMNPGEEVLVPEPFYANYNGFAVAAGVEIKPIPTKLENDWELPPIQEIEKLIGKKTKAIMICNPNNPTGKVYGETELRKIADLAKKHNLFLFGDEVYREFIFNGENHTSLLHFHDLHDNVIMMDSISKRYSSCGARLGAFVSRNKEVMKAALAYAQARLCPPTIAQILAIPSVELGKPYFDKVLNEYRIRRDIVVEYLNQMDGVRFTVPNGAFYITIGLPVKNAEDFVVWLLSEFHIDNETVMLAPANGFYKTPGSGDDEVRIAFVLNAEKTKKAMRIFKEGLAKYLSIKK